MADQQRDSSNLVLWPYSDQYKSILREGHHKQAPSVGSPTLVWHMALWPRHAFGDDPGHPDEGEIGKAYASYDADLGRFFVELSDFVVALQKIGRVGEPTPLCIERFDLPAFPPQPVEAGEWTQKEKAATTHAFATCSPQALAFTLWWEDAAGEGRPNINPNERGGPKTSDLRVRCHLQTHRDHATLSFYIDAGKMHSVTHTEDAKDLPPNPGERRRRIVDAITKVREVSGEQIRKGYIELPRNPERGVSPADAEALLAAADFCYEQIWSEFSGAFKILGFTSDVRSASRSAAGPYGERFADFRGLVLSVSGLKTEAEEKRVLKQVEVRNKNAPERDPFVVSRADRQPSGPDVPNPVTGAIGFGKLVTFDAESNESNTVLRSLWPFMRRMTPWADFSDWVGCGIIDGRALYVTALGSEAAVQADNEESGNRDIDVPSGHLPPAEKVPLAERPPGPLRYLIVTKGEPPREQLGRYIERINAIGTMRLFALRNMASIRNASIHIEVLGRMLDGTLQNWETQRTRIDKDYQEARNKIFEAMEKKKGGKKVDRDDVRTTSDRRLIQVEEDHIHQLNRLIRKTETKIIQIAGGLDGIGEGGSGRLLYAINRANAYAQEYERMFETLAIKDVDGWINYRNFVNRSVKPALEFIAATGMRLSSVRMRIQTVTDTIQTAALIVEAAATQKNTGALEKIQRFNWLHATAIVTTLVALLSAIANITTIITSSGPLAEKLRQLLGL